MSEERPIEYVHKALDRLKGFQRATVDVLYSRLYGNKDGENQRCMLVADEVGLGKTIVACGLIARLLKSRNDEGKRKPLKVTYICSNQVIAQENIGKLNLFPNTFHMARPVSRIAFLAKESAKSIEPGRIKRRMLEINSLTPATSFEIHRSAGNAEERGIIYAILCRDLKMKNRRKGLRWLLRGGVTNTKQFHLELEMKRAEKYKVDLPDRFIRRIKRKTLTISDHSTIYDPLSVRNEFTLYDAVIKYADLLNGRNEGSYHTGCRALIVELRRILIQCCLRYVDADIYILDEFQRFKDLLDEESEEESAILARKVMLSQKHSKVLLLSATPFKALSDHHDLDRGEEHYSEFSKILEFLCDDMVDKQAVEKYEQDRKLLYKQILDLRKGEIENLDPVHCQEVQTFLRSVMCRTERNIVADNPDLMIEHKKEEDIVLPTVGDIENFRQTDRIVQVLNRLDLPIDKPVEYCKSAIYPLSFLDHYKIKETLKEHLKQPEIQECLKATPGAWINLKAVNSYQLVIGGSESKMDGTEHVPTNTRLARLVEKAIGERGAEMLWIPPSLTYYPLEDSFAGAEGFTKTLLFSSWIMVPRMIGTLLSYEVERRTTGSDSTRNEAAEKRPRKYFSDDNSRRPRGSLHFRSSDRDAVDKLSNMSNFCLLYPSLTLAHCVDPVRNVAQQLTLTELRNRTVEKLRTAISEAKFEDFVDSAGESSRWYWAAPLLLDCADVVRKQAIANWFNADGAKHKLRLRSSWFRHKGIDFKDSKAKEIHFSHFKNCFEDPKSMKLGAVPEDLAEVLADLALGSPAVLTLRSLIRVFGASPTARTMVQAFDAADEFINLFNKPESICAIRMSTQHHKDWRPVEYWRMVVRYCSAGCLQSVLDEYFHVLKGQGNDTKANSAVQKLLSTVNLNTSQIKVDSLQTFMETEDNGSATSAKLMRCHYAVEFGSQRMETEEGGNRANSLREVFNSPFRPFVLATTSIGQEGLDFHAYCRRIVHWNLPGNAIDLEQREGRINRYKALVIRQAVASKYRDALDPEIATNCEDVWHQLFEIARQREPGEKNSSGLVPYWHVESDEIKIERVIPCYPYSTDQARLAKLLQTLTVYRLAFGQPRQSELVEHLLERDFSDEELKQIKDRLMINLSPIRYTSLDSRK